MDVTAAGALHVPGRAARAGRSLKSGPINCTPSGIPSVTVPAGSATAGFPSALTAKALDLLTG
jgi:hypothetical protein